MHRRQQTDLITETDSRPQYKRHFNFTPSQKLRLIGIHINKPGPCLIMRVTSSDFLPALPTLFKNIRIFAFNKLETAEAIIYSDHSLLTACLFMPSRHWKDNYISPNCGARHWHCLPSKSLGILQFRKSIWRFFNLKTVFAYSRKCHSSSDFKSY